MLLYGVHVFSPKSTCTLTFLVSKGTTLLLPCQFHTLVFSFMLAIQQSSASPHSFTTFLSLIHNFSLSHFKMPNNSITAPVNDWPAHSKTGKLEITPFSHLFIIFNVTNIRLYWCAEKNNTQILYESHKVSWTIHVLQTCTTPLKSVADQTEPPEQLRHQELLVQ